MPTLHWIGKDKVINHHRDVPYKVLEHAYGFDAKKGKTRQPTGSGNKVIHGDNLEALKSLLPDSALASLPNARSNSAVCDKRHFS